MSTYAERIQAQIDRANATTSAADTTLVSAIGSLIDGYGGGGSAPVEEGYIVIDDDVTTNITVATYICADAMKDYYGSGSGTNVLLITEVELIELADPTREDVHFVRGVDAQVWYNNRMSSRNQAHICDVTSDGYKSSGGRPYLRCGGISTTGGKCQCSIVSTSANTTYPIAAGTYRVRFYSSIDMGV